MESGRKDLLHNMPLSHLLCLLEQIFCSSYLLPLGTSYKLKHLGSDLKITQNLLVLSVHPILEIKCLA